MPEAELYSYLMIKNGRVIGHIVADDGWQAMTLKNHIDPDACLMAFVLDQNPRLMEREVKLIEEKVHA